MTTSIATAYRTVFALARGGMGEVEVAVRQAGRYERLVAIKRLKPELVGEPDVRAMFVDEARVAGLVRHPNVVSVVDVGEDARGPFLVMEYVDGVSASDLIESAQADPLPVDVCMRVARDAAEGLHAAHELCDSDGRAIHLVHRDVSPQNILVGFDGVARVTDFGIAKALGRASKTSTGVLKGKLGYMAPEQLRFEDVDRRADLFALGVVLFELLTGQRLYRSQKDVDGPRRILTEPPPDLADHRDDVEPELVELVFELLAKDRAARPKTAADVARRLDALVAQTVAVGAATPMTELLVSRFGARRELHQARIADALAQARTPMSAPSPRRSRARMALGAAGLGLIALVATAAALRARTRAPVAPLASPPDSALASAPPIATDRALTLPAASSAASSFAPAIASFVPASSAALSASPAGSARSQRTPKPRAPRRPAARGGVPIWESY